MDNRREQKRVTQSRETNRALWGHLKSRRLKGHNAQERRGKETTGDKGARVKKETKNMLDTIDMLAHTI